MIPFFHLGFVKIYKTLNKFAMPWPVIKVCEIEMLSTSR